MFLELDRLDAKLCNPQLQPAIELYREDKPVEAMESAWQTIRGFLEDSTAEDWLAVGNMAGVCGLGGRSRACWRIGHQRFPDDGRLAALYAWDLSAIGQSHQCMKALKQGLAADKARTPLLRAVACYNHSLNGWKKTARKFHKSAIQAAGDDAVVNYVLARSAARRTEWENSIKLNQKAIELVPDWTRAKMGLFDAMLCADRRGDAEALLQSSLSNPRHIWRDFSLGTWLEISKKRDEAIEHLEKIIEYYPLNSRTMKFVTRQLVLLLMQANQIDRARKVTEHCSIKGFEEWEDLLTDDQRTTYISVPEIAQTTNHCVPTVAAMVAKAQGYETSPAILAQKMDTRHGTPMWRMIDAMKELGFRVVCVKPKVDIIEKMLEQNVPLIGEISGVLSGHVDVVCGFNSGLKLIHLRDPMHWYGMSLTYESAEQKYEASCSLWAMVAPDKVDSVTIKDDWINREAEAMIDLGRATANGDRIAAEEAFEKIGDDHPLSFARDCAARHVVLTDRETSIRIKKEVNSIDPETELTLPQVRSLLAAIDEENADHILNIAKKNQERLGKSFVDYVDSQVMVSRMQWKKAEKKLALIAKKQPGNERVWSQLGRVKMELGKTSDAERCFAIALEISPDRELYQSEGLTRLEYQIPFEEQLAKAKAIEAKFPWSPEIHYTMANLLASSGDGLAYEQAMEKCIRFFPRNPYYYQQLSSWYLLQNRFDLAREVMAAGHELMTEEDFPVAEFEKDDSEKKDETESTEANKESDGVPVAELAETGNAFRRHYATLSGKARSESFEAFQSLDELAEVKRDDRSHLLNWQQSAELLSLEVGNLLSDNRPDMVADPATKVNALRKILPVSVRGIGEQFAGYVADSLNLDIATPQFTRELLDWFSKIAPESHKYPDVEFQKAWMLDLCGEYNKAEELVNQIIREHPCYVSGWYRLGALHSQRLERGRAFEMYEKCLELQPGHYGALVELGSLAPIVAAERETELKDALCNYLPYNQQFVYDAALSRVEPENHQDAVAFIDSHSARLGPSKQATAKARLLADIEKYPEAIEALDGATIEKDDQYAANWVRVDVAVREERFDDATTWLNKLEETNPQDESVVDQKVRLLRLEDPQAASKYAEDQILGGNPLPILAHVALSGKNDPLNYSLGLLEKADDKSRDLTALALHEAVMESEDTKLRHDFLDHCHNNFPHLNQISQAFVYQLGMNGNAKRSIEIARQLLEREPNNPAWMSLLGWAVQDSDPAESIRLLKQEFELTDSVDTLAKLARGYQLNGNDKSAKEAYRKVLLRNPNHTIALTNLMFEYQADAQEILPKVIDTIQKQMVHSSDQYFLVQAVKLAVDNNVTLPPEWIALAFARLEQLGHEVPFLDEAELLLRSVHIWLKQWDAADVAPKIGFWEKVKAKYRWPKTAWVPPKA